ncbi:hypothetical protein [Frankia sp. AgB32]|uniref:hypothetical protein n=1 Tax=Frankia sp. AgB32 TaxID=631119 RepID=UPI00200F93D8|nr:hypothetical protein [Frankia sp. AgB32]MCK9895043.1 hypothetical protein [Frankia sp. AgB32]
MTRNFEPYLALGDDGTSLTVHQQVDGPQSEPLMLLRVTSPRTGLATAHLTTASVRLLLDALRSHLATTDPDSDPRHIAVDAPTAADPDPDDFDPWALPPAPGIATDPGTFELHRAQTSFTDASRERDRAAAWLARAHLQHAAYATALTYPEATWITVELSTTDTGAIRPSLLAVLTPTGDTVMDSDGDHPAFHQLALQVEHAILTALTIAPGHLTWTGRRTLHLSHYATW